MALLVSNVPWSKDGDPTKTLCAHLKIESTDLLEYELLKRSVDARRRPPVWQANYRVVVKDEQKILAKKQHGVRAYSKRDAKRYQQIQLDLDTPIFPKGHKTIVIGAGPAGMFGALRFAEGGSSVLLLDEAVLLKIGITMCETFGDIGKLNPESNVVYGEGGQALFQTARASRKRLETGVGIPRLVDLVRILRFLKKVGLT